MVEEAPNDDIVTMQQRMGRALLLLLMGRALLSLLSLLHWLNWLIDWLVGRCCTVLKNGRENDFFGRIALYLYFFFITVMLRLHKKCSFFSTKKDKGKRENCGYTKKVRFFFSFPRFFSSFRTLFFFLLRGKTMFFNVSVALQQL